MRNRQVITIIAAFIVFFLAASCDDPIVGDDRPDDGAHKLFEIIGDDVHLFDPSPSPDGNYLAFCYSIGHGDDNARLATYNLQTGEITDLLIGDSNYTDYGGSIFSPDSQRIMHKSAYDVYIYDLNDASTRQITPGDSWYIPVDWGSAGESVIVKEVNSGKGGYILYEIDLDTLEMTYLFSVDNNFYGKFSPDHNRFLATWNRHFDFVQSYEIRLYDTTTWGYEVLFENSNYGYVGSGGWSQNGEEVLLVHKEVTDEEFIRVYNISTGSIKYATWTPRDNDEEGYATSRVDNVSFSASEDKIFYDTGFPKKIWVVDAP